MECRDIINTLGACLQVSGTDPGLAQFIQILLGVVLVTLAPLIIVILLIWVERKFAARVQDRIGPNRVGPFGLLQTIADALKLITKEDITPAGADRLIYNLAPIISVVSVILIWAVIPLSPIHIGVDLEIGVLYFVAVGSIGTLAIMMAGWSSNNKYALLGAFRVVAQLVSYEVPMVFALLIPVMLAGSMGMQDIVDAQRGMWYVVLSPLAAFIFFLSAQAETGRAPFDLIEAESELVAGYNIEYSGMKFGLFFAGEFVHVLTNALLLAALFFGGWVGPFVDQLPVLGFVYMFAKASLFYLFSLLLRNTLPRVRIDQLMAFNWKFLVPVSIVNVIVVAGLMQVVRALGLAPAAELSHDFVANLPQALIMLAGNLAIALVVLNLLRAYGRRLRQETPAVTVYRETEAVEMLPQQVAH
jgi:NADH-quinone oxidoreductase subunit H